VFGNKLLRRIFECNKEEVARGWKKLHDETLYNLCPTLMLEKLTQRIRS
jgi:hypothetical protein